MGYILNLDIDCEMMYMINRTPQIKQIIGEINGILLNPVIPLDTVRVWEERWKIVLPKDYVDFITQVGDGGIICSKTWEGGKLIEFSSYEKRGYSFKQIEKPFTLTESWMPDWGDSFEEIDSLNEVLIENLLQQRWTMIREYGSIILLENNTDDYQKWHLVVNGPCSGEVWLESEFGVVRYSGCSFSDWLLWHLDGSWEKYANDCARKEKELREKKKKQQAPRIQCIKAIQKSKIRLKAPASLEEIRSFEEKHDIKFPEDYINFMTTIGNGGKNPRLKYPKIYSLSDLDNLTELDKPFFLQTHEQLDRLVKKLGINGRIPYLPWKQIIDAFNLTQYRENEECTPWLFPNLKNLKGCIPFFSPSESQNHTQLFLILNGEFRGELWLSSQYELVVKTNFRFPNGDKIDFMNLWEAYLYYQYCAC